VRFGISSSVIDHRMIKDSGADRHAVTIDAVQPQSLATVFEDERFRMRRIDQADPYAHYLVVNTARIPDLFHRRAIAAALDRAQLRTIAGGRYAGELSDGVVKPDLVIDHAATGLWTGLLGESVPAQGNPGYARELLDQADSSLGTLQYDYPQTTTNDKLAASVVASLGRAGIEVRPNPIGYDQYIGVIFDPAAEGHLAQLSWGPDWPNASTIIPELFTPSGGFNLSQVDDPEFSDDVQRALAETDREAQASLWKELHRYAMSQAWVVPTLYSRNQRLVGSRIRAAAGKNERVYLWMPYGAWPYADLYIEP
jgi:peptide/nickel transport system substrate-binding protein